MLVAPLMPGINDSPELVDEIVSIAEEAGATFVNGIALHLRPGVKEVFMSWLSAARPDLVPRYDRLYEGRAYAPNAERKRIGALVRAPNLSRTRATAGALASRRGARSGPGMPSGGNPSRRSSSSRALPQRRGYPSTPVEWWGAPTGFDWVEPRCRRKTVSATNEPTARNSDCQF